MLCLLGPGKAAHSRASDLLGIQLGDQVQQDFKNNLFCRARGAHCGSKAWGVHSEVNKLNTVSYQDAAL